MYAVISDGGRQYKVQEGQILEVDYRDVSQGDTLQFDRVLAVSGDEGLKVGTPALEGVSVSAEVLGVNLGKKIVIRKFRRRKTYRRKQGHRQLCTKVKIQSIEGVS